VTAFVGRITSSRFVRGDLRAAILPWIVTRALVLGSLWGARFLVDQTKGTVLYPLRQGLFGWDATWYRLISEKGYDAFDLGGLRFFPLVSLATRALSVVFLGNDAIALAVIVNLCALVAAALVHRIVVVELHDERTAQRAAWFTLLVPSGVTLVMGYAEATFMMLVAGAFLAYRTKRWGWGAALGALAALCRPSGLLLVIPAAIEVGRNWKRSTVRERVRGVAAVGAAPMGTAVYLAWCSLADKGFWTPFSVQSRPTLRGATQFPPSRALLAIKRFAEGDAFHSGRYVFWMIVFGLLLYVVARRLPASYTWFGVAAMVLALSAKNLESFERYGMGALVLALGLPLVSDREEIERGLLVVAAGGLVAYSFLAFTGVLIP